MIGPVPRATSGPRASPPSRSSAGRVPLCGSPAGSCRCSSCVSLSCGDPRSVRRVELPVPARQVARRIRRRDREALHCIADGGHADGEAVVAAGLAVVAVPHLEVEVALSGVLDPQLAAPMHGTIRAARVRRDLRKGDFRGVEVKWMPIDLHLESVVDPLQGALVREADAVRILLTGPDAVGPAGLVLLAGRRLLLGLFRWVIDAAAARDLDRHAYEVPRLKVRQRLADPRGPGARLPVAARRNHPDPDG